jgi:hypothetical protein
MYVPSLFGPVDGFLEPVIGFVLFGLALANVLVRGLAFRSHRREAREGGAEAVSRYVPLEATNVLLILGSFYFMTLEYHGGMVLSVLVLGMFISDVFEFEARKVEARRDVSLEPPNSAIAASVLVLLYAGYQSLFFLIAPIWNSVI